MPLTISASYYMIYLPQRLISERRLSLEVIYKNNKIRAVCTNAKVAERQSGRKMAEKTHQRIDEISAADSVEMMVRFHIGRCHPLSQNRKGQFAVDLVQPYRLVFEITEKEVQIASIQEITDYH